MKKNIWVAGFPSFVGGADTELLHNIDLWVANNVQVDLVPMFGYDDNVKKYVESLGCKVHDYNSKIFKNKIVVSYCNGEFLNKLPEIVDAGKPKSVIWFNCMTWTFPDELIAHKNGWINYFGFVSKFQEKYLKPKLEEIKPIKVFEGYRPYFNPKNICQNIKFRYKKPESYYGVGRVSRDDPSKFSNDMWNIFYKVNSPYPKKTFILGYNKNVEQKTGAPLPNMDWMYWSAGAIPIKEFHDQIHCIIHKTGGSRESYCRIVPECYAFGTPIIVEDDFAFPEIVVDGITGYRCKSSDEMSFRASELAFDENKRKDIIMNGQDYLINDIANIDKCWESWNHIL
jgi:hypothetical protein